MVRWDGEGWDFTERGGNLSALIFLKFKSREGQSRGLIQSRDRGVGYGQTGPGSFWVCNSVLTTATFYF